MTRMPARLKSVIGTTTLPIIGILTALSPVASYAAKGIFLVGETIVIDSVIASCCVGDHVTTLDNSPAFELLGTNPVLTLIGPTITEGDLSRGIVSGTPNATITIEETGSVSTLGFFSYGIDSYGDNATITNNGVITTQVELADGIRSSGDNAYIINNGSISSAEDDAIVIKGQYTTIINNGSISTNGPFGAGVLSFTENNTVINNGNISTTGDRSQGITIGGNSVLTNNGIVVTAGKHSDVIAIGNNSMLTNNGVIRTIGSDAQGIAANDNTIINNSGLISVVGNNSYAIQGGVGDTILNVLPGSQIIGRIDLGGADDNDTANVYIDSNAGQFRSLTFENTETINLLGTGTAVVAGNTVVTLDTTVESTHTVALAGTTNAIHNVIGQRMIHTTPLKPVQLASLELSPGMYFEEHKPVAWYQFFGGKFNRDAEGGALGYDHDHMGMSMGYEWDRDNIRFGLMGGIVRSETDTEQSSYSIDTNNYYIGAYANRRLQGLSISGSLVVGYGDYEHDRLVIDNVNGGEIAESDFGSWFFSPGLTVASAFKVSEQIEIRPSASINYSIAWLDSYTERGATNANFKVDDRKAEALTTKAQLAAAYLISESSEVEIRIGMNSRHTDGDDIRVSIAGSNFKFATAGDEDVSTAYAGASLRYAASDTVSLVVDIEAGGDSDEDYVGGNISLEYLF